MPAATGLGEGNEPVAVHADVAGLQGGSEYLFRLVGENSFGTTRSYELSFTTKAAVNLEIGAATEIGPTTTTLNGTVDPEGAPIAACEFEYVTEAAFLEAGGFTTPLKAPCEEPDAATIGAGQGPVPVKAEVTGLTPNTEYAFRLSAESAFGTSASPPASFETHGPPTLGEVQASGVTETTATIEAQVDPHGEPTSFQVEYVTQAQFEAGEYAGATPVPVPAQELGSGVGFISASQVISELTPGTTYHYRVVAQNPAGAPVIGPDKAFATFGMPGLLLPDGRAYELVSPAEKEGGEVIPGEVSRNALGVGCFEPGHDECLPGVSLAPKRPLQTSADGNAVVFFGQPFSASSSSGTNEYRSVRTAQGWATVSLSPPNLGEGSGQGYLEFSPELLANGLLLQTDPSLVAQAPSLGGTGFANLYLTAAGTSFQPLLTSPPPNRGAGSTGSNHFVINYAGANQGTGSVSPLSHVIFLANDALTQEIPGIAPAAPVVPPGSGCSAISTETDCDLYEWTAGGLRLVNVLPGNSEVAEAANFGSANSQLTFSGEEGVNFDHAISDDGARIFWSRRSDGQVFVRIGGVETRQLADPGDFITASPDGSKVLLGDGCLYDVGAGACSGNVTEGQGGFEGILGASADLTRIYYVDTAQLTGNAENANEERAVAGAHNLYVWDEGAITFVARLLQADNNTGRKFGDWKPASSNRSAQVTPDGRYLAFMSAARLTGYDNDHLGGGECLHEAENSPACFEVFEYDATTQRLTCPSCNPTGTRPLDGSNLNLVERPTPSGAGLPQPTNLLPDGRLFFESRDVLSAADQNGKIQDVYEWAPTGFEGCQKAGGCVSLISAGRGSPSEEAYFADATPSGSDVFFVTRARLVRSDHDELLDLYDARVGGGLAEPEPVPPCGAEAACRGGAVQPGPTAVPGSLSLNGGGNPKFKKCRRGFVRKHGKCAKKHGHRRRRGNRHAGSHKRTHRHHQGGAV
ncbi:MAG: fibronectin type III domain-containing protein [Solirubrobacterales bacterium]|nr:fibronectin type III domain-containing protein [Solirubrobacterales bacterium]